VKAKVVWIVKSRWTCGRDSCIAIESVSEGNECGGRNTTKAEVTKGFGQWS
jgi:hypothetical protein